MALLPRPLLLEIHQAAVNARLDPVTLLRNVNVAFVASLDRAPSVNAQILGDLSTLNDVGALADGSVPLVIWLENALALAGPRVEAEVFRRGLAKLGIPAPPPPPEPHRTDAAKLNARGAFEGGYVTAMEALPPARPSKVKLLFMGANPSNLTARALGAEVRDISDALRKADMGDRFEIAHAWAVRVSDLHQCLLEHKPTIVHFSGHGTPDGKIIVEDAQGQSRAVPPAALTRLFEILRDNIRCVVLNACSSQPQAEAIARHIDCVVGMSAAIGDAHAIAFATAFYRALGFGRTVKEALALGCNEVMVEGLSEADVAVLLCREGVRPEDVRLVQPAETG